MDFDESSPNGAARSTTNTLKKGDASVTITDSLRSPNKFALQMHDLTNRRIVKILPRRFVWCHAQETSEDVE